MAETCFIQSPSSTMPTSTSLFSSIAVSQILSALVSPILSRQKTDGSVGYKHDDVVAPQNESVSTGCNIIEVNKTLKATSLDLYLPTELLLMISELLTNGQDYLNLSLVCRRFHRHLLQSIKKFNEGKVGDDSRKIMSRLACTDVVVHVGPTQDALIIFTPRLPNGLRHGVERHWSVSRDAVTFALGKQILPLSGPASHRISSDRERDAVLTVMGYPHSWLLQENNFCFGMKHGEAVTYAKGRADQDPPSPQLYYALTYSDVYVSVSEPSQHDKDQKRQQSRSLWVQGNRT